MSKNNVTQHPIDAVILWVDGNDEQHRQKVLTFLENKQVAQSKKFRARYDQVNEIKFTVDSLLKFAPYLRYIFIVTDNQTPKFLSQKTKKYSSVFIIDHKVIFKGFEEFLPTFNSRSIESCIYRIPGLAEHFIYLNDDFFLINETKPEDFFINGLPVLRGEWKKFDSQKFLKKFKTPRPGHKSAQQYSAKLIGFNKYYNFRHTPHPMRKSTLANYFDNNQQVFLNNIKYKFRNKKQFLTQGLANHIEIKNNSCILEKNLQLLYFRSYKKPLFWYKFKLNSHRKNKLFMGMQSLDQCPPNILKYLLQWLSQRTN